jgi:murein DD-endopeptidase MepM/ murein hydrolase activator NlpD
MMRRLVPIVLVACLAAQPALAASPRELRQSRVRLVEIQARLDELTAVKRVLYARFVDTEALLKRLRMDVRQSYAELARLRHRRSAAVRREIAAVLAPRLRYQQQAVVSVGAQHREVADQMREQGDLIRDFLSEIHDIISPIVRDLRDTGQLAQWRTVWPTPVRESGALRACPVAGPQSLTDTFGAPRPGGRIHEGNDILAAWETPVLAAHSGLAVRVPNELGGRAVIVYGPAGRSYYAHLSGYGQAGPVQAGAIIGYIGNSGNAMGRIHHLHFEYHPGGGAAIDPYGQLLAVCP